MRFKFLIIKRFSGGVVGKASAIPGFPTSKLLLNIITNIYKVIFVISYMRMFSFLYKGIVTLTGVIFFHEVFRNTCPEYYTNLLESMFFEAVCIFSRVQIKFKKYKTEADKWIQEKIQEYPILQDIIRYFERPVICFEYVKDGDVIYSCTKEDFNPYLPMECDFIVYTSGIDKILYYNDKQNKNGHENGYGYEKEKYDIFERLDYTKSETKFLLVDMNFKYNDQLGIKFTDEDKKYNYMIQGNRVDRKFLTYFLRRHYLDKLYDMVHFVNPYSLEGIDYTLKTMDSNVQIKTYGPADSFTV